MNPSTSPDQPTPSAEGLLPCPFCGKAAATYIHPISNKPSASCKNRDCPCSGEFSVEEWNRRPAVTVPRSVVEALEKCIQDIDFWSGILEQEWPGFDGQLYPARNQAFDALELLAPYLSQPPTEERTSEEPCAPIHAIPQTADHLSKPENSSSETVELSASNAPSDVPSGAGAWRPIETADKEAAILLWFPAFGGWLAGPWRGCWSYVESQWVIQCGLKANDGKYVLLSGLHRPTHWQPLPAAPQPTATEETK